MCLSWFFREINIKKNATISLNEAKIILYLHTEINKLSSK